MGVDALIVLCLVVFMSLVGWVLLWSGYHLSLRDGLIMMLVCPLIAAMGTVIAGMFLQRLWVGVLGVAGFWAVACVLESIFTGSADVLQWIRQEDYAEALNRFLAVAMFHLLYAAINLAILIPAWWVGSRIRNRRDRVSPF